MLTEEEELELLELEEQEALLNHKKGRMRQMAESVIRSPALPIGGAVAGGIAGGGLASIPLAGLGAAGGESFRQLAARGLGMEVPQTSFGAAKRIGVEGLQAAGGQALGLGAGKLLAPIAKPAVRAIGRGISGGIQKITGIADDAIEAAFKKPLAMFTAPTKKTVEKAYAASEFPNMTKSLDEVLEAGTGSHGAKVKQGAKAIKDFVEKDVQNPRKILAARKALDKQIGVLETQIDASKGSGRSSLLQDKAAKLELRGTFNRALDFMVPGVRKADSIASKNLEIAPFRQIALPGKINFTSTEGLLRAVPGLPTAIGTGVSAAGGLAKAATSNLSQKLVPQVITQMATKEILKDLTEEKAKEYLRKAMKKTSGNIKKARVLADEDAKKDGYDTRPK